MNTTKETSGWGSTAKGYGAMVRCAQACRATAQSLRNFEEQFARRLRTELEGSVPAQLIRQAWNEAEALAWSTRYPWLFLPDLAEEKIQDVRHWAARQEQILSR